MEINTKELEVVKTQVSKAVDASNKVIIKDDEQMLEAGELRKKIKTVGKMIKDKKESITKPINQALKDIRALFSPLENQYELAESTITQKMLAYQSEQDEKRHKAEAEAEKKLAEAEALREQGREKEASKAERQAEKKIEKAPEVIIKSDDFHTRTIKKFRVVDETKVPREYLIVDDVKIRKAMMAGVVIVGVEYYEEKTLI